jgi:anti-sigma factor RsiW
LSCQRPLDELEVEAIAAADAADLPAEISGHVEVCAECRRRVEEARRIQGILAALPAPEVPPGFAARVGRLRSLSRRERRSAALWAAPGSLAALLVVTSVAVLAPPGLSSAEQGGLWAALLAPALAAFKAVPGVFQEWLIALPAGLSGLSEALRTQTPLALVSLALLLASSLGLRALLRLGRF